jgi:3-oxoadipate enol-lactonase
MKRIIVLMVFLPGAMCLAQATSTNVGDAVIRYQISGQGQTIVFIHGWAQDLGTWAEQAAAFAQYYRVLRYDRRGFGKSTGYADVSADPADLLIMLDSLKIRSIYLVGLSAGAEVALRFALNYPDRVSALVLYGKGPIIGLPRDAPPGPLVEFRNIARNSGIDSVREAIAAHPLAWMPPNRPDLKRRVQQGLARYEGRDLLDPHPQSGRVPPAHIDSLSNLRVPTLVINGDHEMPMLKVIADTLARRIPNARRVVIVGGGHGAHFAEPDQFNNALKEFFLDVERRPRR